MCEEQLKEYTDYFNNTVGVHKFKVEYIVLDKAPVGIIYGPTMFYHEDKLDLGDCLLYSMHVPKEIVTNIKTLLREIQEKTITNTFNTNSFMQSLTNIVEKYNMVEGQKRGLKLDYHVFSGATDISFTAYKLQN